MRAFFPLPRGDCWYLAFLIGVAAAAFLPWSRQTMAGSLPVFAWLMVALMVLAPTVALVRLIAAGRRRLDGPR